MKIAIASSGLGHVQRGIEAWAKSLAEGLARQSQPVVLFHGAREGVGAADPFSCPNTALRFSKRGEPWVRWLCRHAPGFMWRWGLTSPYAFEQRSFARALIPYLRSGRFDILHTQDVELAAAVERAGKKGRHPARVILGHGTDEPMAALRRFRYLQHLSPDYRDQAMREIAGETLHFCIPNFVDVHEFKPGASRLRQEWGIPGNAFVIGASGALKRGHKRMDVLVEEVAHLKAKTGAAPWLLLAGASTDETQGIERMAGELLGERCRVLRDLPFEKMVEFYRALDLFVHPAPEEVFGICLLEAMACGIPAVAHDSPTLKWVVGSGGWSVDVRQKEFLAGLWPRILAGDSALRDAARAHVVDLFSWEAVYPAFMQMYQAVLENRLDA